MPLATGIVALVVVAALIFFGLAHRALDRLHLTDGQALLVIAAMIAGSFVDLPLMRTPFTVTVNVGGALLPLGLVVYLVWRADSSAEKVRSLVGALITAAVVLAVASVTDFDPGRGGFLDPVWLFGIVGGATGYLVGRRSRRAAFVSGTLGLLLTDVVHAVRLARAGQVATVMIGGAGAFDMIVLAGLIALGLAEVVGETLERLSGGPGPDGVASLLLGPVAAGLLAAMLASSASSAQAAPALKWGERTDGRHYTLYKPDGSILTYTALLVGIGDVYVDASNHRWEVGAIRGDRVEMKDGGMEPMPAPDQAMAAAQAAPGGRAPAAGVDVAVYFTHSDESYVPTSGTPNKWWGDIYRVGDALASELRRLGFRVEVSRNNHNPHDGQAYLRSRRTAAQLLRTRPAILVDVHRDAVPPQVYETSVQGHPATKVRLVVGRQNQNMSANFAFAKQLKSVADRVRPGIVEGIFIAQGDYNQDLMPRAILLEFGAHTNPLQLAEEGARLFAPVLPQAAGLGAPGQPSAPGDRPTWQSAAWLVVAVIIGAVGYLALNAGSADEVRRRLAGWWRARRFTAGPNGGDAPRGGQT